MISVVIEILGILFLSFDTFWMYSSNEYPLFLRRKILFEPDCRGRLICSQTLGRSPITAISSSDKSLGWEVTNLILSIPPTLLSIFKSSGKLELLRKEFTFWPRRVISLYPLAPSSFTSASILSVGLDRSRPLV